MIEVRLDTLEELAAIVAIIRGEPVTPQQIREQVARLNQAANALKTAKENADG